MPASNFEHLKLLKVKRGIPKFPPGGGSVSAKTEELRRQPAQHARNLNTKLREVKNHFSRIVEERESTGGLPVPVGVPLLLKVDPKTDIEYLRTSFNFEIVSEQDEGFVIVASEDTNFQKFITKIEQFGSGQSAKNVSQVHEIVFEPTQIEKLKRILSEDLFNNWPNIQDAQDYIIDIGIACVGKIALPNYPEKVDGQTETAFNKRIATWQSKYNDSYMKWDILKIEREEALESFIGIYRASVLQIIDGQKEMECGENFVV